MADARLRALEREAIRGDGVAGARLLLERVRLGALAPSRLHLAAYAGDARARLALGPGAPVAPAEPKAWVLGFESWGQEVCVRAAAAVARAALPLWEGRRGGPVDPRPRQALEAVDAWLDDPCVARALTCRARAEELWAEVPDSPDAWPVIGAWFVVAAAAWTPAPWTTTGPLPAGRLVAEAAARCASLALGEDLPYYLSRGSVRPVAPASELRAAVADSLTAWALMDELGA